MGGSAAGVGGTGRDNWGCERFTGRWSCPGIVFPTAYPPGYGVTPSAARARNLRPGAFQGACTRRGPSGNGRWPVPGPEPGQRSRYAVRRTPYVRAAGGAGAPGSPRGRARSGPGFTSGATRANSPAAGGRCRVAHDREARPAPGTPCAAPRSGAARGAPRSPGTSGRPGDPLPRPRRPRHPFPATGGRQPRPRTHARGPERGQCGSPGPPGGGAPAPPLRHRTKVTASAHPPGTVTDGSAGSLRRGARVTDGAREPGAGAHFGPESALRRNDAFPHTLPYLFGQLPWPVPAPCTSRPNPRVTRVERGARRARTLRGLATGRRRTSQRADGVQRFVIEWFTPRCHVDIVRGAELVTPASRDTVDSIMTVVRRGTRAGPRGNVQERNARQERGATTTEGGLAP